MKVSGIQLATALGHDSADKRIDILRHIGEVGSISQAARAAGVSYRAAWQALETLSNLADAPLVTKAVGGSGGGGAALTSAGEQLLKAADRMRAARNAVLASLEQSAGDNALPPGVPALILQTSMRNQLPCTVARIKVAGASVRVELALKDGLSLYSQITRESKQLLGLHPGQPVLALCKATAVTVAKRIAPRNGHNLLRGQVTHASTARRGGEIGLRLSDNLYLVGFGKAGHGLKKSACATAVIAELGVVIALPG